MSLPNEKQGENMLTSAEARILGFQLDTLIAEIRGDREERRIKESETSRHMTSLEKRLVIVESQTEVLVTMLQSVRDQSNDCNRRVQSLESTRIESDAEEATEERMNEKRGRELYNRIKLIISVPSAIIVLVEIYRLFQTHVPSSPSHP
jgi:hypothetical protein